MTFATWITIFRILLIPVFAILMAYYARSGGDGQPDTAYRFAALWVFLIAAVSDAVDGFVARYFNQKSLLGAWLDPLADKLLGMTALISLSFTAVQQEWRFPIWFTALIISKDALILLGCFIIHMMRGSLEVRPNLAGKLTTAFLLVLIVAALWRPQWFPFEFVIKITTLCALLAFFLYVVDLIRQLQK
jgi:cardiolipin synthase